MATPPPKKIRLTIEQGCSVVEDHNEVKTEAESDKSHITSLPSELLVKILSLLTARDKLHVQLTCRRLHSILTDSIFWRSISWRDYFPPRDDKAMKCALQFGITSLKKLRIYGCGSIALSKFKNVLTLCSQLHTVILFGFTLSQRQIAPLLLSTSTKNLEVEIADTESIQIFEMLTSSQVSSVVLHTYRTPNITMMIKLWSDAGYSPFNVDISIYCNSKMGVADFQFAFMDILSSLPHCSHKARFAVGYSSIHTHIKKATMQPVCEISNKEDGFGFSQFVCEKLGLSTCMLSLTRVNVTSDRYTAASAHKLRQPFLNKMIPQDTALIKNVTELCLASVQELSYHHLMLIATNCSHLIRLNIQGCTRSLSDLSGLSSIASNCHGLQGINFDGIHYNGVESIIKLWEIFTHFKYLSHLRFCYCLICSCRTVLQRCSSRSASHTAQSRVSHFTPQVSDTEHLKAFIRKLTSIDTLELTCHTPSLQDDSITFRTLSCFASVQSLHLEGCPQKVDVLKDFLSTLKISVIHISARAHSSLRMPSNLACYQNLQKIAIIAHCNTQIVITENIASALAGSKKLTHVYLRVCFDSPDAITTLIRSSPSLMGIYLIGKLKCILLKTRSCVKKLEKLLKTELTKRKVQHQVALYIQNWPSDVSQVISKAISLTELSPLWISKDS